MKTINTLEVMNEITDHARRIRDGQEKIKPGDPYEFTGANSPGDRAWQGDLCVTLVSHETPTLTKTVDCGKALVPDNGTQGSKHRLDSLRGVMFTRGLPTSESELDGPQFVTNQARVIEHPIHGHIRLCPGTYDIGYQRELDRDMKAERRARD